MLQDLQQRSLATTPNQSFIVQAPAGSGKTEILTQRFLRLLSTVHAPEQIIALTFTRKAANEMRERILMALKQAFEGIKATSPHQQQTLSFANNALARNEKLAWNLLEQPSRLRIMTIDALCQSICQSMPIQDKQIPYASVSENAKQKFVEAAGLCLRFAMENKDYQDALKTILLHLDNRQDVLIDLFSKLLQNRDQWLNPIYQARDQEKAVYEQALALIEQHELSRFKQSLPPVLASELVRISQEVASIEPAIDSPRAILREWRAFDETDANTAQALSALILTGSFDVRKAFDHHVGLQKGNCTPDVFKRLKSESQSILTQLGDYPEFIEALLRVKDLPKPSYDPRQWEALEALFTLLPLLVGHLQMVFLQYNEVDFTAISQQALMALGSEDEPTDMALYLDHAIHHLLVDEFQDTSITQYQLITQLVQGWLPDDGKTLFVVGDPMQSIYRFRQAEVGLFLKAQQQGIGPVDLIPLELQCNFRSTPAIVQWVNEQFSDIFPAQFDIESGAVSFHPSAHVHDDRDDSGVYAFSYSNRKAEAKGLVELIKSQMLTAPDEDIAILVRSRSQLGTIIKLLREEQIPYQGVDIDLLAKLPHIRDIWSLTQALLMPANRLAWLELLRSPYGGLDLHDIYKLSYTQPKASIYERLGNSEILETLSEEGQTRARFIYDVMDQALSLRFRKSLSEWINETHQLLKGKKILTQSQQNDLEQFWILIDRFEEEGQLTNPDEFKEELSKLYSQEVTAAKLQVMTIHKSKGLEFDSVIIPSLSSPPKAADKPLLRWLKLPAEQQDDIFLLSPVQAMAQDKCPLYDYLGKLDAQKSSYELQRLFYVAATRAKKRLYLFDNKNKAPKNSFRSLLPHQEFIEHSDDSEASEESIARPALYKLALSNYTNQSLKPIEVVNQTQPEFSTDEARVMGVLAHQILQWICDNHPDSPERLPWAFIHYELNRLCLNPQMQSALLKQLTQWLHALFSCPVGQWIIQKHKQEHNEYELLIKKEGKISTRIIDRTFVDNNNLWIIDFKTGSSDPLTQSKHQKQVNEYADILSIREPQSIRCGLYYLATNLWVDWAYSKNCHSNQ